MANWGDTVTDPIIAALENRTLSAIRYALVYCFLRYLDCREITRYVLRRLLRGCCEKQLESAVEPDEFIAIVEEYARREVEKAYSDASSSYKATMMERLAASILASVIEVVASYFGIRGGGGGGAGREKKPAAKSRY